MLPTINNVVGYNHIMKIHSAGKQNAWITIANKDGGYKQYQYRIENLTADIVGSWGTVDGYYSQNSFYAPYRRIEYLKELKTLYIDIDIKDGRTAEQVLMELQADYFGQAIPVPNEIVLSGNGLHLKWYINPVPAEKVLPLWSSMQNYLHKQLEEVGSDSASIEPCRVLRFTGTTNSKGNNPVTVMFNEELPRYELRDLQREYLPQIPSDKEKKVKKSVTLEDKEKAQIYFAFRERSLYYNRLLDLNKLLEMRNYNLFFDDGKGCHEIFLFLYRYWTCCYESDTEKALQDSLDINQLFQHPMNEKDVVRATKSAEVMFNKQGNKKAIAEAKAKGFPSAGYRYSNVKLIDLLGITEEEQKNLNTIISREEKQARDTKKKREQRGSVTREEYREEQKRFADKQLHYLRKLLEENPKPKWKDVAKDMGISDRQLRTIRKQL